MMSGVNQISFIRKSILNLANEIFENVEPYGDEYILSWSAKFSMNKKLTTEEIREKIFNTLEKTLSFKESDKNNSTTNEIYPLYTNYFSFHRFFDDMLNKTSIKDFKMFISVIEELLNTKNIYGRTDFYRSFLLFNLGPFDLKENKERIQYICESKILTSSENICDISTNNLGNEYWADYENKEFYERYIPVAWNFMSVFHDVPSIVQYSFPDFEKKARDFSSFNIRMYMDIRKQQKIDLLKIEKTILLRKFSLGLLCEIQNELDSGKLKKSINKIIEDFLTEEQKRILLLEPLQSLNIKAFKEMMKLYPDVLGTISYKDIASLNIAGISLTRVVKREGSESYEAIKKVIDKYKLKEIESGTSKWQEIVKENIWNIISITKNNIEKKQIKSDIMSVSKKKVKSKNRL